MSNAKIRHRRLRRARRRAEHRESAELARIVVDEAAEILARCLANTSLTAYRESMPRGGRLHSLLAFAAIASLGAKL